MKLIVGLGNPGIKYQNTRHNVGFMVVDCVLKKLGQTAKLDTKFNAEVSIFNHQMEKVICAKPSTYMNLSGDAVYRLMHYYNINIEDVLVIVDDVNLETGKLRLRPLGGHGGHNGLRHIIGLLKSEDFKRIRLGIGYKNDMPLDRFVLGRFDESETPSILNAVEKTAEVVLEFIEGKAFIDVMTKYNTQT